MRVGDPVEPAAAAIGQPTEMARNTTNDQTGTWKFERNPVVERWRGIMSAISCNPPGVSLNQNALVSIEVNQRKNVRWVSQTRKY